MKLIDIYNLSRHAIVWLACDPVSGKIVDVWHSSRAMSNSHFREQHADKIITQWSLGAPLRSYHKGIDVDE
jgi:hypothetical protein